MIKGTPKKNYNEFEEELNQLIGSFQEANGLEFYLNQLHDAFLKSEVALTKYSDEYLTEFNKEDFEVKQSIVLNDPEHSLKSIPLVDELRKSYFITVHSEFEKIWKEIITIYNNYFTPRAIISLSYNFETHPSFNTSILLDKIVLKYKVLFSYNYIRNKIVHQKAVLTAPEYQLMLADVDVNKIKRNYKLIGITRFIAHFV